MLLCQLRDTSSQAADRVVRMAPLRKPEIFQAGVKCWPRSPGERSTVPQGCPHSLDVMTHRRPKSETLDAKYYKM